MMVSLFVLAGPWAWNCHRATETDPPPPDAGPTARAAHQSRRAVYLLIGGKGRYPPPFCTAFAVTPTLLATNAHCVAVIQDHRERGAPVWAVMNGLGQRLEVRATASHPRHRPGRLGFDLGLLRVNGRLPVLLKRASLEELQRVTPGTAVLVQAFPDSQAYALRPRATLRPGVITHLKTSRRIEGSFADSRILQHTAEVGSGTSGAPLFGPGGSVVGIHSGTFIRPPEPLVRGPDGRLTERPSAALPPAGYATRIDALEEVFALLPE
jgi:hypothetical protein